MKYEDCPIGTKAYARRGGYWTKTSKYGWKWCTGATFPTPDRGEVLKIELPKGSFPNIIKRNRTSQFSGRPCRR